jgi:hypothetical protein
MAGLMESIFGKKKDSQDNGVKKKPFFLFDTDYLLVIILLLIVLFSSKGFALELSAPQSVEINDKASFLVEINNASSSSADLQVSFFAPVQAEVIAPKTIAPNEKTNAKITVYNKYADEREINATIEVVSSGKILQKEITLIFHPKNSENSFDFGGSRILNTLFSFGPVLSEVTGFNSTDWVIFVVLVIIAAFLLIAFISRLRRRA